MKLHQLVNLALIFSLVIVLSGCDVITGIFEAGIWTGLIGVVLVVALVIWLFSRFRRR